MTLPSATIVAAFDRLAPRDRQALKIGAWIVAPVLASMLLVQPYRRARHETRDALAAERTALAIELAALRDAPRDARLVRQGRHALLEEGARLFDGADAVAASAELASWVADQAAEAGLQLEDSETRAMTDARDSSAVAAVEIRAAGDVLAVVAFLRALEDGPRLARVERLALGAPAGAEEGDGSLMLTATVTAFARRAVGLPSAADTVTSDAPLAMARAGARP